MIALRLLLAALLIAGSAGTASAQDFSTPENAIRTLEAAYIAEDIEAAVAAKDFREEAKLILARQELADDDELVVKTADVLEQAFRFEIKSTGFPKFGELQCSLGEPVPVGRTMVKITETCLFPDGGTSVEDLHVVNDERGWRLVNVPNS